MNEREQVLFKKLEAVVNNFNDLGKYVIVNTLVLYLTFRALKCFLFFNSKVQDELPHASAFANSVLRISEFTFRLSQSDWN